MIRKLFQSDSCIFKSIELWNFVCCGMTNKKLNRAQKEEKLNLYKKKRFGKT